MSRLTIWNPWKAMPREMWDENELDWVGDETEMDVYEEGDNVVVELKAPGFTKDNFDIRIESNKVTISGKSEEVTEEGKKDRKYYRKEIRKMSFTRSCDLPASVIADQAKAVFKNGVLTVTLPKSEEAKPKKIDVEIGE